MTTKRVIKKCFATIDGNDMKPYFSEIVINAEIEEVEGTTLESDFRDYDAGLEKNRMRGTIRHDEAMAAEGILWPLRGTKVPVVVRFKDAASSPTNPEYSGTLLVLGMPLGGGVGTVMESSVDWPICSTLTRTAA